MNEHTSTCIDAAGIAAYYDGEITGERRAAIEAHLAQCPRCREALETLRSLSALLQTDLLEDALYEGIALPEEPTEGAQPAGEPFVEQVLNRLPPPRGGGWAYVLEKAWQWTPLVLFVFWAALQAITWVGGLALLGGRPLALPGLGWIIELAGPSSGKTLSLATLLAANLWLTLNLALLYGGWLASWFAYRRKHEVAQK